MLSPMWQMASLGGPLQPISMRTIVALYSLWEYSNPGYKNIATGIHWERAIVALYSLKSRVSKYRHAYIYTRQYTPPDLSLT